jgi:hypothetical protein
MLHGSFKENRPAWAPDSRTDQMKLAAPRGYQCYLQIPNLVVAAAI